MLSKLKGYSSQNNSSFVTTKGQNIVEYVMTCIIKKIIHTLPIRGIF